MRHDQFVGVTLFFRQGTTPLDSLRGVGNRSVQRRPARAQTKSGDHQSGVPKDILCLDEALSLLASHKNKVVTRDRIFEAIWGKDVIVVDRTIDVHIRRLRKALEPYGFERFIQTVRGTGYRFSTKSAKAS